MEQKDIAAVEMLCAAALGVAKMRYRGNQTLTPCWCECPGQQCVGQAQCIQAVQAIKDLDLAKFMIEYRKTTKEVK